MEQYNNYFNSPYNQYQPNQPSFLMRLMSRLHSDKPLINLALFIMTIFSTWLVRDMKYAIGIVSILLSHEMGHYLMCRRYNMRATLPYFIPLPIPMLNPFGTMGAVIKIEDRMPNRRALFDIGISGPLAGFIIALPLFIYGLSHSTLVKMNTLQTTDIIYGKSILYSVLARIIFGPIEDGYCIVFHSFALAGWVGLFVTALNLLPLGQLDGGHILYALYGAKTQSLYKMVFSFFLLCICIFPGWVVLSILFIWIGYNHPPPIEEYTLLDKKRRILAYIIFIIFILSFTVEPFKFRTP